MATMSPSEADYFEKTSEGPYDRHTYEIVLKDGHAIPFETYEQLMVIWFHQYPLKQFSHVNVLDCPNPQKALSENRSRKLGFV